MSRVQTTKSIFRFYPYAIYLFLYLYSPRVSLGLPEIQVPSEKQTKYGKESGSLTSSSGVSSKRSLREEDEKLESKLNSFENKINLGLWLLECGENIQQRLEGIVILSLSKPQNGMEEKARRIALSRAFQTGSFGLPRLPTLSRFILQDEFSSEENAQMLKSFEMGGPLTVGTQCKLAETMQRIKSKRDSKNNNKK